MRSLPSHANIFPGFGLSVCFLCNIGKAGSEIAVADIWVTLRRTRQIKLLIYSGERLDFKSGLHSFGQGGLELRDVRKGVCFS